MLSEALGYSNDLTSLQEYWPHIKYSRPVCHLIPGGEKALRQEALFTAVPQHLARPCPHRNAP